jgi:hypothetical protein
MSGILDLAKAFEETSKQQAQRTGESVKSEFVLEQSISEALKSSGKNISDAIHEQNTRQTTLLRRSVTIALIWILVCGVLLIGILSGILWFQGTLIASRLDEMNSYSQQLTDLKAKSGAGWKYSRTTPGRTSITWCCRRARRASKNDKQVVTYTAK